MHDKKLDIKRAILTDQAFLQAALKTEPVPQPFPFAEETKPEVRKVPGKCAAKNLLILLMLLDDDHGQQ